MRDEIAILVSAVDQGGNGRFTLDPHFPGWWPRASALDERKGSREAPERYPPEFAAHHLVRYDPGVLGTVADDPHAIVDQSISVCNRNPHSDDPPLDPCAKCRGDATSCE
jgi:hypothetical protein